MTNLDNIQKIKEIDKENFWGFIEDFPQQINNAWQLSKRFILPSSYANVNRILILGMGGSGIGGQLVKNLYKNEVNKQIEICQDYKIPAWVDKNTLVLGVSFSGDTEETLAAFTLAYEKNAKLAAITTNGKLEKLSEKFKIPVFKFTYNSPPRQSLGYLFIIILSILNKLNFIFLTDKKINSLIESLEKTNGKICPRVPENKNLAKQLANKIYGFIPVVWTGDFTSALGIRFKQQLNENAKTLAFCETFPELNHNSIVGLDYPKNIKEKILIILIKSPSDHKRNHLRMEITKEIFRQKKIKYLEIKLFREENELNELLNGVLLLDYVAFYVSLLNNVNPTPTPTIGFLKKELEK
jgi:glucose/mannose-6-phosphate isomerase